MDPKISLGFVKPSSRSFGIEMASADAQISVEELLRDQPNGRLRNFLSVKLVETDDADTAFRNVGGTVLVRTRSGKRPDRVRWIVKDGALALRFEGSKKGTKIEVRLLVEEHTWM